MFLNNNWYWIIIGNTLQMCKICWRSYRFCHALLRDLWEMDVQQLYLHLGSYNILMNESVLNGYIIKNIKNTYLLMHQFPVTIYIWLCTLIGLSLCSLKNFGVAYSRRFVCPSVCVFFRPCSIFVWAISQQLITRIQLNFLGSYTSKRRSAYYPPVLVEFFFTELWPFEIFH